MNPCRWLLLALLFVAPSASPGQGGRATLPAAGRIFLDVVVTSKSGEPVSGLQQQDFAIFDNKAPQTITSFQAVDGRQAAIEIILLVDAVNTGVQRVAYERDQIDHFLRADEGHLAHPTTLAVLTDTGTQIQEGFSIDGNALSAALDKYTVSLRSVNRSAGFWGATERFQISLEGLNQILAREAPHPGRKILVWISPGWPLLSGPNVELDNKEQQQLFADIVNISTQLMQAHVTLYSVDPLGTADAGSGRTFYWESFLKGVSKPSQVEAGNLGLEVIATQSGGLALSSSNDVAALLEKCVADLGAYYELSFDPASGDRPNEYHHLEIHVDKPGLTARTRQGYYSQP
jgi:VWFA-related protein